jgi:ElaB/YqjD/DUF883 family membrane-anchored ribosome-binding protein
VRAWGQIPQQITELRANVNGVLSTALPTAQAEIRATRRELLSTVNKQTTSIREDLFKRVDSTLSVLDRRTGDALDQVKAIRSDLKPTLTNAAALVKDAQDSWDDLYPDVKATVESATVATTSVARASESIVAASPKIADSSTGIAKNVDGITSDLHTITTDIAKPRSFFGKLRVWLETIGKVLARLI